MNEIKNKAIAALSRIQQVVTAEDYGAISAGLHAFATLSEQDAALAALWEELADVPLNPETECIEAPFLNWPAGTGREEIWHWFDARYSKGVHALLYGGNDATSSAKEAPSTRARLKLPSGDILTAESSPDDPYPSITIFLDHQGARTVISFIEWNPDKPAGKELCIGAYYDSQDDTSYYDSYFDEPSVAEMSI